MRNLFICLLMGVFSFSVGAAEASKTLTIAADIWCPINCAPDSEEPGIGVELAKQVFEPLGYRVNYVVMPWSRALEEVRAGRLDAVIGANSSDDRTLLFPTYAITDITDGFFVRADDPMAYKGLLSLSGLRLGIIKDYGYSETIKRFIETQRKIPGGVQEVAGDGALAQNIKKLQAKRIDVVVESVVVMNYTLRRMGLEGQVRHIGGIQQGNVYLAFSPALAESAARLRQYDNGIKRLASEGVLSALYARYGLKP